MMSRCGVNRVEMKEDETEVVLARLLGQVRQQGLSELEKIG